MQDKFNGVVKAFYLTCFALLGCGSPNLNLSENSIVSTTLCADGYLLALPELEPRLAALSWQSRSALSRAPERLRSLPQADNDPERRLRWAGATQISSAGGSGDIVLNWGEDFETVWANFQTLSARLGASDPSKDLKSRLRNIQKPAVAPRLLYLDRSGATAGPGTFVNAVIEAAGGTNIIENSGWQSPDTETLINLQPDIILTSFMDSDYAGVNDRSVRQAALALKIETLPRIDIPGNLWPCAGPGLIDAAEQISQAIAK